jgi:hypothetical protein
MTVKWPPTDLELLEEIYRRYYSVFSDHSRDEPARSAKVYVSIDIHGLAERFNVDPDIIFGRLYYDLEPKYGFEKPDGSKVNFFTLKVGEDAHAVQYPLLASVVARLRDERKRHRVAIWLSVVALVISAISVGLSVRSLSPQPNAPADVPSAPSALQGRG